MQSGHHTLGRMSFFLLAVGIFTFAAGCGGGGGGPSGDRHGEDTPATVSQIDDVLGIQGTLYADPNGYVTLNYKVQDGQYDPTSVEVQYGWDVDGNDVIEEHEYALATKAPGSEGTTDLVTSPEGAAHTFVWASLADIGTNRVVNQDYEYTVDGRRQVDAFGDVIYRAQPGMVFRMSPMLPNGDRDWRYTTSFSISNNNPPTITRLQVTDVVIPPEGVAEGSVNEHVEIGYAVADNDRDPVTIAVDWVAVPLAFDPSSLTTGELDALPWSWATFSNEVGEGTSGLSTAPEPTGVDHAYGWSSVDDVGTDRTGILLRFRPIDGKNEVGDWTYLDAALELDNLSVVVPTNPLPAAVEGAAAVLLTNGNVLIVGGMDENGAAFDDAMIFYPTKLAQTTTGNTAPITGGMLFDRAGHTATRLYRNEDPADATKLLEASVVIVGGTDANGDAQDKVEVFNPKGNTFTEVASLNTPRTGHAAILLNSGKVFVVGGVDENGTVLETGEVYDPVEDSWAVVTGTTMGDARTEAAVAMLPGVEGALDQDGLILIVGGKDGSGAALDSIEIFDPSVPEFLNMDSGSDLAEARYGLTLTPTLDPDFPAVAVGGMASPPKTSIERWDLQNEEWETSGAELLNARTGHVATLLGNGLVMVAGGQTNESGDLTPTVELYDVVNDVVEGTNGDLPVAVLGSTAVVLENGRTAIFGGMTASGATDTIQIYTPADHETMGFNNPPTVEIRTPTKVEPWAFGVVIPFRVTDAEGDLVRATFQYKIKPSSSDDTQYWSGEMLDYLDRWLPAGMLGQTVLGTKSSGTSGLSSRTDATNQAVNPIDNPDDPLDPELDRGEHQFVWKTASYDPVTEADIVALQRGGMPKGDYNNVYVRAIVSGASESGSGGVAATGSFAMTKNAPVIARVDAPIADASEGNKVYGNIVFPYYLQDSDLGDLARVVWQYGKDLDGDGKIVDGVGGEAWYDATPFDSNLSVTYNGTAYQNPTDLFDLETAQTGNEDADGIPWGKKHWFVWNSVENLGAPATTFDNIIMRLVPYDYPGPGPVAEIDQSLGIEYIRDGFSISSDPNGMYLTSWSPTLHTTGNGTFLYTGVNTDEPMEFTFSNNIAAGTVDSTSIRIYRQGTTTPVEFYPEITGNTVKIWPQAQELPARQDVLFDSSAYDVMLPGYDPSIPGSSVIQRDGYTAGLNQLDTNKRYLLVTYSQANAFQTGTGAMQEGISPNFAASPLVSPSPDTNVPTSTTSLSVKFTERLDPDTVTVENFMVTINAFGSTFSVVPGTISLANTVDSTGAYATVTYTLPSGITLPAGATVEITGLTGLTDLYGNPLGSPGTTSFDMTAQSGWDAGSFTESFDDAGNRNYDETTFWWGNSDPEDAGDFSGYGTKGAATGLFSLGTSTTSLTVSSQVRRDWDNTNKGVFEFKDLTIKSGGTLYFRPKNDDTTANGNHPITLRVAGTLTIESGGFLDVTGSDGADSKFTTSYGTLADGGAGGAAGGAGGSAGTWTSPGTSIAVANENGFGHGGGKRGNRYRYTSTSSYPYYGGGGGGGGHGGTGSAGSGGYSSLTVAGAGGAAYGDGKFADPSAEGGSGGGSSSTITTDYSSYDSCWAGATGGGGGGVVQIIAGALDLYGHILASGGDGGDGIYHRYTYSGSSYIYRYTGGGGGGSGGGVQLLVIDSNLYSTGRIDVSGGKGGKGGYTYSSSSYYNPGGDGAGGFVSFGAAGAALQGSSVKYVGTSTLVCTVKQTNGTYPDLTIASNVVMDPSTGKYGPAGSTPTTDIPGWQSDTRQIHVGNVDLKAGATLTVTGSDPLVVMANGNVTISGTLEAIGNNASPETQTRYDYTGTGYVGFYHYDEYRTNYSNSYHHSMPGKGTAGGGDGGTRGSKRTYTNSYGWYHRPTVPPAADNGDGAEGASSLSGGRGGAPGTSYSYGYGSGTYSYRYSYYYYSGAGGGGGSEGTGKTGVQYKYYPSSYYAGKPGAGGTASITPASVSPDTVRGGGGGGGGALGGYIYYYRSGSYQVLYYYGRGQGTGAGGGGGGVGICAKGTIHLAGTIDVAGGNGGNYNHSSSTYGHSGGAGGGGGGNVVMHTETGYTFGVVTIDCSGGLGGLVQTTSYQASKGGDGAVGALILRAKGTAPTLPPSAPTSNLILGNGGQFTMVSLSFKDTGVSTWQTTGQIAPEYRSTTSGSTGTGRKELWVQGAMYDLATGEADTENATEWVDALSATEIAKVNGYMFFRFKLVLQAPSPNVTSVTIGWRSAN